MNGDHDDPEQLSRGERTDSELANDFVEARRLFTLAASRNHANAHNMIRHMELYGFGVPQNVNEATKWFRRGLDANKTDLSLQAVT